MGSDVHGPLKRKHSGPISVPGFDHLEFEPYSETFELGGDTKEFVQKIKREEEQYKQLDELAEKCVKLVRNAESGNLPSLYWKVGDEIYSYERRLPRQRESYEKKSNLLDRLALKIRRTMGKISLRYLRKIYDYRRLVSEIEIDDSIPWSVQFEFLELGSNKKIWNYFARLYKDGRLTNKEEIRNAIDRFRKTRSLPKP